MGPRTRRWSLSTQFSLQYERVNKWAARIGRKSASLQDLRFFWFERAFRVLGLRFPLGVTIVGLLPALVIIFGPTLVGYPAFGGERGLILGSIYFVTLTIQLYGARYVGRRIKSLKEYVESTLAPNLKVDVSGLYELRGPIILFLVLAGTALPAYYMLYDIPVAVKLIQLPCWVFFSFVFATFFSAYGHSMYKIYLMGKLPLHLKPFTEDKTLGLKPFGRTSLQLSGLYFFLVASSFIPFSISYDQPPLVGLVLALVFLSLGTLLFFAPLLDLRRQLLRAKTENMDWIAHRYTALVTQLKSEGSSSAEEILLTNKLASIDKLQKDIGQIRTWPFDTQILESLAAIIVTVIALVVAHYVQVALP